MKNKPINLFVLIISIIVFFIIGFVYEIDYRILTRNTIKFFARYTIDFYGVKEFRIFETDIAFILTLIPISYFFLVANLNSFALKFVLAFECLLCIIGFYCLYCTIESEFIRITVTLPPNKNGVLLYHHLNIDYRIIPFFTIISTFGIGLIIKKRFYTNPY